MVVKKQDDKIQILKYIEQAKFYVQRLSIGDQYLTLRPFPGTEDPQL